MRVLKNGRFVPNCEPVKDAEERFSINVDLKACVRRMLAERDLDVATFYASLIEAERERSTGGDNPETLAHYKAQAKKALRISVRVVKQFEDSVAMIKSLGAENDRIRRDYVAALKALKKAKQQLRDNELSGFDTKLAAVAEVSH
jgi:hypothetical protein